MIHIPPCVKIPLCIERGSVFNFYIDFDEPERQSKNRFFVIVNRNPKDDAILVMLTPTTQIEKTKAFVIRHKISSETIVEVKPGEHRIFTNSSAFNCNNAFEVGMKDLIQKIQENGSMNYPKMPEHIIKSLVVGIKKSPRVSQDIRNLL